MTRPRPLYIKIYFAFLGILTLSLGVAGLLRHLVNDDNDTYIKLASGVARLAAQDLPFSSSPALQASLNDRAQTLGLALALWDGSGQLLASTPSAPLDLHTATDHRVFARNRRLGVVIPLADGRRFGAFIPHPVAHGSFLLWLCFFAAVLAVGCYPLARGITRRLERLEQTAQAWGRGELTARARDDGADEIAAVGRSFNVAAERVQSLIAQQRRMLASASHELRSPLARLRLAVSLLETAAPERRVSLMQEADEDVQELDALIEDLLLAARAEGTSHRALQAVDFHVVVALEAERAGVAASVLTPCVLQGDAALLRRLVRNLIENAQRHGDAQTATVALRHTANTVRLVVEDRGAGVPAHLAERIFEPFYRPDGHDEGQHQGVGLGLALVRQVATHHGGRAWYEPRSGGGSRFVIELPLDGSPPLAPAEAALA